MKLYVRIWSYDILTLLMLEIKKLQGALNLEKERAKEFEEAQQLLISLAQENSQLRKEVEDWKQKYSNLEGESMELDRLKMEKADLLKEIQALKEEEEEEETYVLLAEETQTILTTEANESRKTKNMLFNLKVQLEIPGASTFKVNAILDTGATTYCVDEKVIPKEAMEKNPFLVHFSEITFKP
ncbi:hypothetical protein C4D60_Mb00t02080 [Musa balbisiana]|uniref:Retropepsins domain-containing protein n=1 Tax=Musa balbisiana TaxID=52838 RepID=A0A4S8I7B7_MUSBA|nr:hypothetical protein C4D60_Mb00t02080 [Musa balbisiana]